MSDSEYVGAILSRTSPAQREDIREGYTDMYRYGIISPDGGMVDTEVSKSSASRLAGSSPALGTIKIIKTSLFSREVF